MRVYNFTIVAHGLDPSSPDFEDRFFEAGCDDATIAIQKGVIVLEFDREAKNLIHAIWSAVRDVEGAGATVQNIEPDGLVTLSDIAGRSNHTRAAVSLWSQGKRGADFPLPVARVTTNTPMWDWVEVSRWLYIRGLAPRRLAVEARVCRYMNDRASETSPPEERLFA